MAYDWSNLSKAFESPGFGVSMGLLQMGQERPWNQPMQTGLLQSSLGQAQAGRMQDKHLDAIKAQQQAQQAQQQAQQQAAQQQAQQMRGQVAQVIQAMNTGQMSRGQGMAQLAQIPGAIELLNKAMPQAGADPMAKFNAWQNMPPEAQAAYGRYRAAERGPGVSVNVGERLPPNYRLANPGDPNSGYVPIKGSVADPETPSKAEMAVSRTETRKMNSGLRAARALKDSLKKQGTELFGRHSKEQGLLYGDMVAALAAARGLGVLQPSELANLEAQLPNPSNWSGLLTTNSSIEAAIDTYISSLESAISQLPGQKPAAATEPTPEPITGPGGTFKRVPQ